MSDTASDKAPLIQVSGLSKSFGSNLILKRISLTIERGEVIGIIGASGSGKSTFLRCLNLLERPDAGIIRMNGERIGQRKANGGFVDQKESEILRYRAEVGMVFQNFHLFPHMTALQNIIEAPISVRKIPKAVAVEQARQLLAKVRLEHRADHYPHELSGGQQQRVAIARALAMEPKLMLFDEVTSALDPELVGEVLTVLRDIAANGMTMVLVSHEMEFINDVATRVLFMSEGDIVEDEAPHRFFASPKTEAARRFLGRMHRARGGHGL